MSENKRPIMRPPTEAEQVHIATLLRRCHETQLAALLDINEGTLRGYLAKERWSESILIKVMALTLDDVPRKVKPKKVKPPHSSRLMSSLTRSELSYYRED